MNEYQNDPGAKVLYSALMRMTEDRTVIKQALQHWVSVLGGKPFDVIETVASMEKFLGMNTQERKVLMIGMHAAENRASHELNALPDYIFAGGSSASDGVEEVAETTEPTPQARVKAKQAFVELSEGYYAQVCEGLRRLNAGDYRELMEILADEGLPSASVSINTSIKKAGASEQNLDLSDDVSESDCQDLCHDIYNLLAEVIGPNDADVVSNKAVSALLDIEAAVRYDPRKLL